MTAPRGRGALIGGLVAVVLVLAAAAAVLLVGQRSGEAPAADGGTAATTALAAAMPQFAPPVTTIDAAVSRPAPVAAAVRAPAPVIPEKAIALAPRPPTRERAAPPVPTASFRPRQVWRGAYLCGQGPTALTLTIVDVSDRHVSAVFAFRHAPTGAEGSFRMRGTYDPEQRGIVFQPGAWIHTHPNYLPVGMEGRLSPDGEAFAGRIIAPGCGAFHLRLN